MEAEGLEEHDGGTPAFELALPARAENVAVIRHAVGGLGDALDVEEGVLSDMKLAVTEACTNVVVHAYPEGEGPMVLSGVTSGRRLTLVVADEGCGMVPRPDSPGLGLGLPLIANLSDRLEIQDGPDGVGTQVEMAFLLHRTADCPQH